MPRRKKGDEFVTRAEVARMIAEALRNHDRAVEEILEAIFPRDKIVRLTRRKRDDD